MENRSKLLVDFEGAFDEVDAGRALEVLDLSDREVSALAAGVGALPDPIREACRVVLDDWQGLDAGARVAALLVLANALAGCFDGTGPSWTHTSAQMADVEFEGAPPNGARAT